MRLSPFVVPPLSAAVLALAGTAAQAEVTFSYGLTAEENTTETRNYLNESPSAAPFTTGGTQTITSGGVSASVNAWADPTAGVFKSITSAHTSSGTPINIAESYARLDVVDTIRLTGPGATASVSITMSYDTSFSGLGLTPFQRYQQISHFMQADSSRGVWVDYTVPNPVYDPSATCTGEGEGYNCPIEAQPTLTKSESAGKDFFREWALSESGHVYSNGDAENTRYTGSVVLTFTAPTNTDINLTFQLYNGSRCFHLADCNVSTDASHSDYLGLTVGDGYSFTSANGYEYRGLAAAVPEPSAWVLTLAGLVSIGWVLRRQQAGGKA